MLLPIMFLMATRIAPQEAAVPFRQPQLAAAGAPPSISLRPLMRERHSGHLPKSPKRRRSHWGGTAGHGSQF
jgi:hypothetical protein